MLFDPRYREFIVFVLTKVPNRKWKRTKAFNILVSCDWHDGEELPITINTRRNRAGKYRITEIEIPADTAQEAIEEILSYNWFVLCKERQSNQKCPPILAEWDFPSARVLACAHITENWKTRGAQLKEIKEGIELEIFKALIIFEQCNGTAFWDQVKEISNIGETIVTVSPDFVFCINNGNVKKPDSEALIKCCLLEDVLENGSIGIVLRTFLNEKISVRVSGNRIMPIPKKELRGYRLFFRNGLMKYEKVSPAELKKAHMFDRETGEYLGIEKGCIFK